LSKVCFCDLAKIGMTWSGYCVADKAKLKPTKVSHVYLSVDAQGFGKP